jgi:hypothetical protein
VPVQPQCKQLASNLVTTPHSDERSVFKPKIAKMFKGIAKIRQPTLIQKTKIGRKVWQPFRIASKSHF